MHFGFPYRIDGRGVTADADETTYIRGLVEQILFTLPGERVNRPTFGSGVNQLVFAPNSPELAAAVQFLVQGALQQYMSDLIDVEKLAVTSADSSLQIELSYLVKRTQERTTAQITREV